MEVSEANGISFLKGKQNKCVQSHGTGKCSGTHCFVVSNRIDNMILSNIPKKAHWKILVSPFVWPLPVQSCKQTWNFQPVGTGVHQAHLKKKKIFQSHLQFSDSTCFNYNWKHLLSLAFCLVGFSLVWIESFLGLFFGWFLVLQTSRWNLQLPLSKNLASIC